MEISDLRGKGKILLMDDEEMIRRLGKKILTGMGYSVDLARDGDEAVMMYSKALKQNGAYDAVILDLTVRGAIGGDEAVKLLLDIDPNVTAIASSGYSNSPLMSHCEQYGFSAALKKPFTVRKLAELLAQIIPSA